MKWSLYLGKISGIKVFIHWTFLILLGYIVVSRTQNGHNLTDASWSVLYIFSLFICVFLHELGHAFAAQRFNIKTIDITMLPIGGVARLESIPDEPKQELIAALAGPLVNVIIAGLILLVLSFTNFSVSDLSSTSYDINNFLPGLLIANVMLFLFNLIPAFPMDGGRVLRAILSFRFEKHVATRIAATIGQLLAIGFVFLGFFENPMLIFIGLFIFLGAQGEANYTQTKSLLKGYKVSDVLMHDFKTLNINDPISRAIGLLLNGQTTDFLVLDGEKVAGTLNRSEMIRALSELGEGAPVGSAMNTNVRFVDLNASLEEIYPFTQGKNTSIMPVLDNQNQLAGVLDSENLIEFIMVKAALDKNGHYRNQLSPKKIPTTNNVEY